MIKQCCNGSLNLKIETQPQNSFTLIQKKLNLFFFFNRYHEGELGCRHINHLMKQKTILRTKLSVIMKIGLNGETR